MTPFKYALIVPAVILVLCSCRQKTAKETGSAQAKPVIVRTDTAQSRDWVQTYEAAGTVRARSTATISSRISSYVQEVRVRQGDRVAAGQTLIVLDAKDLELGVRKAQAVRTEAASMMPELESAIASAKSSLDLSEITARRIDGLFEKKSVSAQEHDEAQARVKAARANYEMVMTRRAQLQARTDQAAQEEKSAVLNRDYSTIVAPFSGTITERTVEPGNLATVGSPLLMLEKEGSYRLEAAVDESRLPSVRIGQAVSFKVDVPACEGSGKVDELVPVVDPASRSYLVKINMGCASLRSGIFGRAVFAQGTRQVTAIPMAAVVSHGQLQSVFVVDRGTARSRLVTLGAVFDGSVEVLSGIHRGDVIVTSPPSGLVDGAPVEVER